MTSRSIAFAPLVFASVLYFGAARPWGRAARNAAVEYARLERNSRQARAGIAEWERRSVKLKETARFFSHKKAVNRPLTHVRRTILAALDGAPVSGVRLQIRAGAKGDQVRAHIGAQGRFIDLVRLAGQVARSETGLVLDRVVLSPASTGATLELDVVWIGSGS